FHMLISEKNIIRLWRSHLAFGAPERWSGVRPHPANEGRRPEEAMKHSRRALLRWASGAVAIPALSSIGLGQTYPIRPVRLMVGYAAGGPGDALIRMTGHWLSQRLGQPFVVENRPGAGSNLATEAVVRAPPDGHTLLYVTPANAINTTLYRKLNFDFLRD